MTGMIRRFSIEAEDRLRYNSLVRGFLGRCKVLTDHSPNPTDHQAIARSIARLCAAARLTHNSRIESQIMIKIKSRLRNLDYKQIDWSEFAPNLDNSQMTKAAILKPWISDRERGVVFTAFEFEWTKLLCHCDLKAFADRYTLVVAPSSSPYNLFNFVFPAAYPAPVFSLINHDEDAEIIAKILSKYHVVPLYTSHWVNPAMYEPLPREKRDIDIIMVAMFGKVKRHHVLFKALAQCLHQCGFC